MPDVVKAKQPYFAPLLDEDHKGFVSRVWKNYFDSLEQQANTGFVSSVSGTANRVSIGGTATDPIVDISPDYIGQSSITTVGTLIAGSIPYSLITGAPVLTTADLLGTANQVILSASGVGVLVGSTNITLSLPQSIGTGSSPTFTGLTLSGLSGSGTRFSTVDASGVFGSTSSLPPTSIPLTNTHILVGDATNFAADVAMSGDATLANTGALTLASVATAGTTGSSTAIPVITIDVKGRTTSITTAAVIAPAGTLTGTTLASNVVTSSLTSVGTIGTGVWQGTSIGTTYTDAKIKTVTGTSNRITIGGTATDPTFDISTSYVGQATIATLGTITTGVWNGTSIGTAYTDAKIKTVTGTSNRITIGGTSTDPTFDISTSYVGQATITTLGTIATGVWNGTVIGDAYIASALTGKTYNGLTLTALSVGFTVAGGTTSKTLTVPLDATVSGTNTGDQTITLTGDVTGSGTGSFAATIANQAVTYAKIQNISATSRFLGRITSGAGSTEELTGTQATILLNVFTTSLQGVVPASGGGTTNFLRADGTWATPSGGTTPTGTGFVHITSGSQDAAAKLVDTADINNSQVTLAKLANIADQTILGNNTGGAAAPVALTASQTKTVLSLNNVENTALSTWAGSTNLVTLGTITTGTWTGTAVDATHGGTNQTSWTTGDFLYSSATNTLAKLAANTTATKKFLTMTSSVPGWNTIVTGDLPFTTAAQVFTSSGTWTKATGVTSVYVICIGGGGGGASARRGLTNTARGAGGGGGGGGLSCRMFPAAVLGATETVTVGTGGGGGAAITANSTNGADGTDGNPSSFGSWLKAFGGGKGNGGTTSDGNGGTAGQGTFDGAVGGGNGTGAGSTARSGPGGGGSGNGLTSGNAQADGFIGGNSPDDNGDAITGGAGGVAPGGNGTAATNQTASSGLCGAGGGGGASRTTGGVGGTGGAGGLYGAGGGGGGASLNGNNSGAGGAGANGIVIVFSMC